MKLPVEIRVTEGTAYVRYAEESGIILTQEITPDASVSVDRNGADEIVGIEILDPGENACVTSAREYAHANGLAFPRDFSGILALV
jgi:uncharacterized protein YuzE